MISNFIDDKLKPELSYIQFEYSFDEFNDDEHEENEEDDWD